MYSGYRMEAISIIGREVLLPGGLVGLGCDTIDHSANEIRQVGPRTGQSHACALTEVCKVFDILGDSTNYPVLIHCTQGKDRTGLIVALVLLLLDVPIDAIRHDYMLSEPELLPEQEQRMAEIREVGLTEDFAKAPAEWVDHIHAHIVKRYQGISNYLESIGVDQDKQQSIRRALSYRPN